MNSNRWEETYSSGRHINTWPFSDLISLYFRYEHLLQLKNSVPRIYELGVGTGNNFPFWRSQNADYFGIESSPSAVQICIEKFPELENRILIGDFTSNISDLEEFDVICDRASVTHNNKEKLQSAVSNSYESLKKGGLYFGIDWFSKNHSDFQSPTKCLDANTKTDFTTGQFTGLGVVHFADYADIINIFKKFEILHLSEKVVVNYLPETNTSRFASWNIVARKPL